MSNPSGRRTSLDILAEVADMMADSGDSDSDKDILPESSSVICFGSQVEQPESQKMAAAPSDDVAQASASAVASLDAASTQGLDGTESHPPTYSARLEEEGAQQNEEVVKTEELDLSLLGLMATQNASRPDNQRPRYIYTSDASERAPPPQHSHAHRLPPTWLHQRNTQRVQETCTFFAYEPPDTESDKMPEGLGEEGYRVIASSHDIAPPPPRQPSCHVGQSESQCSIAQETRPSTMTPPTESGPITTVATLPHSTEVSYANSSAQPIPSVSFSRQLSAPLLQQSTIQATVASSAPQSSVVRYSSRISSEDYSALVVQPRENVPENVTAITQYRVSHYPETASLNLPPGQRTPVTCYVSFLPASELTYSSGGSNVQPATTSSAGGEPRHPKATVGTSSDQGTSGNVPDQQQVENFLSNFLPPETHIPHRLASPQLLSTPLGLPIANQTPGETDRCRQPLGVQEVPKRRRGRQPNISSLIVPRKTRTPLKGRGKAPCRSRKSTQASPTSIQAHRQPYVPPATTATATFASDMSQGLQSTTAPMSTAFTSSATGAASNRQSQMQTGLERMKFETMNTNPCSIPPGPTSSRSLASLLQSQGEGSSFSRDQHQTNMPIATGELERFFVPAQFNMNPLVPAPHTQNQRPNSYSAQQQQPHFGLGQQPTVASVVSGTKSRSRKQGEHSGAPKPKLSLPCPHTLHHPGTICTLEESQENKETGHTHAISQPAHPPRSPRPKRSLYETQSPNEDLRGRPRETHSLKISWVSRSHRKSKIMDSNIFRQPESPIPDHLNFRKSSSTFQRPERPRTTWEPRHQNFYPPGHQNRPPIRIRSPWAVPGTPNMYRNPILHPTANPHPGQHLQGHIRPGAPWPSQETPCVHRFPMFHPPRGPSGQQPEQDNIRPLHTIQNSGRPWPAQESGQMHFRPGSHPAGPTPHPGWHTRIHPHPPNVHYPRAQGTTQESHWNQSLYRGMIRPQVPPIPFPGQHIPPGQGHQHPWPLMGPLQPSHQQFRGHIPDPNPHVQKSRGHIPDPNPRVQQSRGHIPDPNPRVQQFRGHIPDPNPRVQQFRGHIPDPNPHVQQFRGHIPDPNPHVQQFRGHIPDPNPHVQQFRGHIPDPHPLAVPLRGPMPDPQPPMRWPMAQSPGPGALFGQFLLQQQLSHLPNWQEQYQRQQPPPEQQNQASSFNLNARPVTPRPKVTHTRGRPRVRSTWDMPYANLTENSKLSARGGVDGQSLPLDISQNSWIFDDNEHVRYHPEAEIISDSEDSAEETNQEEKDRPSRPRRPPPPNEPEDGDKDARHGIQ